MIIWTAVFSAAALAAVAINACARSSAAAARTLPDGTVEATFTAAADAYVDSSHSSRNYGRENELRVDTEPVLRSYLRFDLSGLSGTVVKATLQVLAKDSRSEGFSVHGVSSSSWSERGITYGNAPPVGPLLVGSGPVTKTWISVDVTGLVGGNGALSLALLGRSTSKIAFTSRETSTPPRLVVRFAPTLDTTPPSMPTGLAATATTGTAASLAWSASSDNVGVTGYRVYEGARFWTTTGTTFQLGGLACATAYSVAVEAYDAAKNASPRATTTARTQACPTPAGDPMIAAAGDIACDPASASFNGGLGTSSSCRERYTSDQLVNAGLAAVLTLGDNQYEVGSLAQYQASYNLSWGRVKSITRPAVGNHEYLTAGATGYFQYFGAAAGDPAKGYYSYDVGAWHLIALNSNCSPTGGCGIGSPQERWLQADLAAHPTRCTLAYWHHPRWSSGVHGSLTAYDGFWRTLHAAGADIVLNGHDHVYERFGPQDPGGQADAARGIREFVVGTGGKGRTSFVSVQPNSEFRNSTDYGVIKLTLHSASYDWAFVSDQGVTLDSGSGTCH